MGRRAVRNGARLLINQTNDAWFEGTAAAVQHMSQSIFRAIENRVPVVRCANFGVSCGIDYTGMPDLATRVLLDARCPSSEGDLFVVTVDVPQDAGPRTFYTAHGDWPFAIPCAAVAMLSLGMIGTRSRLRQQSCK